MEYKYLETRNENGITTLLLSREKNLNALNYEMLKEIRHFFEELNHDHKGIKGVILTGKGSRAFAAGADIKELMTLSPDEAYGVAQEGNKTMDLIEQTRIPVIAALNGYALGGGLELALACHIRIAAATARLGLPESSLGLIPGYGGTQRLTHIAGRAKAAELICSGEMISAEEAKELRLVSYVTEAGKEVEKAAEIIEKMSQHASTSVGKILAATGLATVSNEDGALFERKAFVELLHSENGKEGMQAFIEKRKPDFRE